MTGRLARILGRGEERRDDAIRVVCTATGCDFTRWVGTWGEANDVLDWHVGEHDARLTVRRSEPGLWHWEVRQGARSDAGWACSHPQALAVGLAALETASMRNRT